MRARGVLSASLLAFAVALLGGCGREDPPAPRRARPVFGTFRWPSFPVDVLPEPSLLAGARHRDFLAAIAFWERHAGKPLLHVAGAWRGGEPYTGAPDDPDAISANALLFGSTWGFEGDVAGLTSLRVNGGFITNAFVLLDPHARLCTGRCAADPAGTSLRRLLAHELGHFLGLGHSDDPQNVMYPEILPGGTLGDRTVDEALLKRLTE